MPKLLLAVLVLLAAGCDERQPPIGPSTLSLRMSGRVLAFGTGAGVPGVTVAFGEMNAVTDAGGSYALALPIRGYCEPLVDGVRAGSSRVTGPAYRGEFLVRAGTCVSRYGTLADARTLQPVAGATVSLSGQQVVSGSDGWYRVDLGCPANGLVGFNTTLIHVSHANYVDQSQTVGRGVYGVSRLDLELQKR